MKQKLELINETLAEVQSKKMSALVKSIYVAFANRLGSDVLRVVALSNIALYSSARLRFSMDLVPRAVIAVYRSMVA